MRLAGARLNNHAGLGKHPDIAASRIGQRPANEKAPLFPEQLPAFRFTFVLGSEPSAEIDRELGYDRKNVFQIHSHSRYSQENRCAKHRRDRGGFTPHRTTRRGCARAHQGQRAGFMRFAQTSGVDTATSHRRVALPDHEGLHRGERRLRRRRHRLGQRAVLIGARRRQDRPDEVDAIVMGRAPEWRCRPRCANRIDHRATARRRAGPAVWAGLCSGRGRHGPRPRLPAWLPRPRGGIAVGRTVLPHTST